MGAKRFPSLLLLYEDVSQVLLIWSTIKYMRVKVMLNTNIHCPDCVYTAYFLLEFYKMFKYRFEYSQITQVTCCPCHFYDCCRKYVFKGSVKCDLFHLQLIIVQQHNCVQCNLDYPNKLGPSKDVQINESLDNQGYVNT